MVGDEDGLPQLRQDEAPNRDAFVSGRDMYVAHGELHVHSAPPVPSAPPVQAWGNVPPRNRAFTGREPQLANIRAALLSGNRTAVQALQGMGGVGKTQLAIEYAHRFGSEYDIVWWLDTASKALFGQQFTELAKNLGCAEPGADQDIIRRAVLSELRQRQRWLLILDNAENPDAVREWLPSGPGHVLITSRCEAWAELAVLVQIGLLPRAESVQLLDTWIPSISASDADILADALGDLPLAITQAGSYLSETGMTVTEYVNLLDERAPEVLNEGKPVTYRATLTAVTSLAYDQLCDTDKDAADLSAICAFLAPEPVPINWFTTAADRLPAGLATRMADPLDRRMLVASVTRTSLARRNGNALTMHRLTQAILRTCPPAPATIRRHAEALIIASRPSETDTPDAWAIWARLLPHLLALEPAGSDNCRLRAAVADAAWYLVVSGNAKDGLDLANQLYVQWRERLGPSDPHTLSTANTLGQALRILGRYAEARKIDEDSLARERLLRGDDHLFTLHSANNLAWDLSELGEDHAARALNEDTYARYRRVLDDDHPLVLLSANNLSDDLLALGEHDAARTLCEDTYARYRRVLGDDHPDTLRSAQGLANNMAVLGEHDAARTLHEKTLAHRRRVLGPDHPDTLRSALNLAGDLRQLGEYRAARTLDEDTLGRYRRVLGEDHPDTLATAINLAVTMHELGEKQAARALNEDTLTRCRRALGENHPRTLAVAENLAEDLQTLHDEELP